MGHLVLVTGGCRSGKSGHAQRLVEAHGPVRTFIATCPPLDGETQARIQRHRRERGPQLDHHRSAAPACPGGGHGPSGRRLGGLFDPVDWQSDAPARR